MTTDKEKPSRKPQILITEEQFVAAERAIADLRARRYALDDLVEQAEGYEAKHEIEKTQIEPLSREISDLYGDICTSPPLTRRAALIKLRAALNPAVGLDEDDVEFETLCQVAAFFEGGESAYVPLPSGISRLQQLIAVEERIRSLGIGISDAADGFKYWLRYQEPHVQEFAAGVDLADAYTLEERIRGKADALLDQISETPPVTYLADVITLLELPDPPIDAAIASLRAIAEKGGVA